MTGRQRPLSAPANKYIPPDRCAQGRWHALQSSQVRLRSQDPPVGASSRVAAQVGGAGLTRSGRRMTWATGIEGVGVTRRSAGAATGCAAVLEHGRHRRRTVCRQQQQRPGVSGGGAERTRQAQRGQVPSPPAARSRRGGRGRWKGRPSAAQTKAPGLGSRGGVRWPGERGRWGGKIGRAHV